MSTDRVIHAGVAVAEPVDRLATRFRGQAIAMSRAAGAAHLASSMSCIDIIAVLYHSVLRQNADPRWDDRDRFILSKGHAATALYAALAYKGYLTEADLLTYGKAGSLLEEHPSPKLAGVEAATGSLGHGLSVGSGMALAARIRNKSYRTYVLMSDGECNEGTVWEAAMFASARQLGNLCAIVDFNRWQATDRSTKVLALEPLAEKFRAFGWSVVEVDGHDHRALLDAFTAPVDPTRPLMIVAHTVKGKGVSFMEDNNDWHYRVPTDEDVRAARRELGLE